jgi:hypothetical protein
LLLLVSLCFCFLLVLRGSCCWLLLEPAGVAAAAGRLRTKLPIVLVLALLLLLLLLVTMLPLLLHVTGVSCVCCC